LLCTQDPEAAASGRSRASKACRQSDVIVITFRPARRPAPPGGRCTESFDNKVPIPRTGRVLPPPTGFMRQPGRERPDGARDMSRLREHVGSVLRNDPFVRRWDTPSSQASCRFRNRRHGVARGPGEWAPDVFLVSPRGRPTPGSLRSLARRRSRGSMQVACNAAYIYLHCHTW
jgi:hypothetical protein